MKRYQRWMAGLLTAAAVVTASIFCGFAASPEAPFADLRIDASGMDKPERTISVDIYRRDGSGLFQVASSGEYACRLNRITRDAGLYIQANEEGVWVSVDYLTDVNGDGVYELLEDTGAPVWDVMDTEGVLDQLQPNLPAPELTVGQPYILSPELLIHRSQQTAQARTTEGPYLLDVGADAPPSQDFPLCMIKLHRTDPADGQDYTQTYYLKIYNDVLIPFDVVPEAWYFDAVSFGLSQGYFAGADDGYFLPDGQLPRSQIAQVLWSMTGSPEVESAQPQFVDVSPDDWFYPAVTWCAQEGVIFGYGSDTFGPGDLLTREQMVTILYQYAQYMGTSLRSDADMSKFTDTDDISQWAVDNMRWAVTNGLISSSSKELRPKDIVSRAELASALYSYTLNTELSGKPLLH